MWRSLHMVPDLTVVVEGQTFLCHQRLLETHSAYFNAVLATSKPTDLNNAQQQQQQHQVVSLPRTTARSFATLLGFLYEGQMKVATPAELHDLIFTAQYLDMPTLLLACQRYLMENFPMLMLAASQYSPFSRLPFYNCLQSPLLLPQMAPPVPQLKPEVKQKMQLVRPLPKKPTCTGFRRAWETPSPNRETNQVAPQSLLNHTAGEEEEARAKDQADIFQKSHHKNLLFEFTQKEVRELRNSATENAHKGDNSRDKKVQENSNCSNTTLVDVASCDGPVTFEKVLNKNYSTDINNMPSTSKTNPKGDRFNSKGDECKKANAAFGDNTEDSSASIEVLDTSRGTTICSDESTDDCSSRDRVSGEDKTEQDTEKQKSQEKATGKTQLYYCLYCDHSFKSYFCYEKHKQRHLHPISGDAKKPKKPLEMNVSFYPCKDCGSKFPSYYFVHKHKRFCKARPQV